MKQGSSHGRTVSENQELFETKQRRLDYRSTTLGARCWLATNQHY